MDYESREKKRMGKNLKEKEEYFKCKIFAILILKVLKVVFLFRIFMSSRCIWNFAQPQSEACRARRIAKIEDEKKKGTVDKQKVVTSKRCAHVRECNE